MKYMVMECGKGRAVLMDEEGRFVFAANLGYEVGQCVTDPVIMAEEKKTNSRIIVMRKIVAAAACIGVISIPCYSYYARNLKTCSAVTITSHAAISMELNSDGKVLRLQSDSEYGREIIETLDIKGKDKLEAANEILQIEISDGYLSDGDTVDVYIDSKNDAKYNSYKTEFEEVLPKLDIKVNVHEKGPLKKEPAPKEEKPEKEKPQPEKPDAPETPQPPVEKPTVSTVPAHKPEDAPTPPGHGESKPTPEHPVPPDPPEQPQQGELPQPEKPERPEKPEHVPPHLNGKDPAEEIPQPQEPSAPAEEKPHIHKKTHLNERPIGEKSKPADKAAESAESEPNTESVQEKILAD